MNATSYIWMNFYTFVLHSLDNNVMLGSLGPYNTEVQAKNGQV